MQLFKILLHDGFLPVLSALGFFILNKQVYGLDTSRSYAGFIMCGVMLVYIGQRYVKSFQRLLPDKHSGIYQSNTWFFVLLLTVLFLLSILLFAKLSVLYQKGILPMVAASVLYVWVPFYGWKPLRHTLMKSFIVALTWSYATVLLPGLAQGLSTKGLFLITLTRASFIMGLVLPFDKYQAGFDASKGIKTLPLLLTPPSLFLFYLLLWLLFYLLPEALWQVFLCDNNITCFMARNIWLILPLMLWPRLDDKNVWLYDLMPFATVGNDIIVELIAPSFCA